MLLEIDGSFGEGGGQILRTSLGLSLVTGRPFRIDKIRAGRQKPGLLRQHLTAVLAAAEVSGASVETATEMLGWGAERYAVESTRESAGPGNVVMVEVGDDQVTEIFTSFGQIGVSAERVASIAAKDAREYLVSCAAAGEHLADQLLLPFALAGGGSFTATKLNLHARTNMEVIAMFLKVRFAVTDGEGFARVKVEPA